MSRKWRWLTESLPQVFRQFPEVLSRQVGLRRCHSILIDFISQTYLLVRVTLSNQLRNNNNREHLFNSRCVGERGCVFRPEVSTKLLLWRRVNWFGLWEVNKNRVKGQSHLYRGSSRRTSVEVDICGPPTVRGESLGSVSPVYVRVLRLNTCSVGPHREWRGR